MDWYLPADHAAASQLRQEVQLYLERHASPGADTDGAVLAFSELVTNAVEHSDNDVWVSLDWTEHQPIVTIHDLGPDFSIDVEPVGVDDLRGRGLLIASHLTEQLGVASKASGGNRVTARLNVERPQSESHDEPVMVAGRLPEPEEAEQGFFPRDSFLRALVVETARTVEMQSGPATAESAVAQVGATIGTRMEDAYRDEFEIGGPLDPAQIGELCVGLKSAIDGDFYVVSADEEKVVLGNRRCPFGDEVRHAPSLCRMTSSVFGGIAARNAGGDVAVHLEERIAVGDPECRVTIWLKPPPEESAPFVHHYRHQPDDTDND